uniref:putative ferric-chelate reductase 1 isoform X2 n=1 Tax=Pristiophorus japonicus TaxID=55135 RepID=UPI00398EF1E2
MRGYTCFVLVFITVTFPLYVLGYSHGRVSSVCASMVPSHGSTEQTSAAPYQITANSSTFNPGDTITVTLKSNSGDNFKGFLLEARAAGSSSDLMPLGTFSTSLAAQTLNCNVGGITHQNSAVSHTSGSVKTQIVVTWIAPDTGNIEFRATVVKTQPIFWTLVKSETIQRSVTNVTSTTARNPSVTNVSSTTARNPSVTNVSSTTARNPSVTNVSSTTARNPSVTNVSSITARNPSVTNVSSTTARNPSVTNVSSATTRDPRTSLTANTDSNVDSFSSDGCGTTKFCFSNPGRCNPVTDPDCYFMSSVPVSNQGLRFEMSGKANGYISLGFSDDQMMGNDDIYICGTDISGEIKVQRAYSTGRSPPRIEQLGEVDVMTVANRNGVIQCSFVTRNNISTAQRAANNMHYLFIAYGAASGGQISKHANIPFISTEKVDVSVIQRAEGNNGRSIFIKTHAALMLIAWMTTGSIGMIIAKFFKEIGGTKKILGKNIWFQLHLSLMLLTVAITIIGFVLIFVHVKGWSYSAGNHPLLGCIVLGLTLIQPTVAIFRPAPDHKRSRDLRLLHIEESLS